MKINLPSCPSAAECAVPEYMVGPCGSADITYPDGSLFYRAPAPYVGPVYENISVLIYLDTRYIDNVENALFIMQDAGVAEVNRTWYAQCLWVKEFSGDTDVVSGAYGGAHDGLPDALLRPDRLTKYARPARA